MKTKAKVEGRDRFIFFRGIFMKSFRLTLGLFCTAVIASLGFSHALFAQDFEGLKVTMCMNVEVHHCQRRAGRRLALQ
jgi:hypothetical protein